VRKLLTWVAGLIGVAALLRQRKRSRAAQPSSAPPSDPAVELREKLAETRSEEAGAQAPTADEAEAAPPEDPPSLEDRRARVHERAQEAIGLMRGPDEADGPDGAA
jgi:hypothetical protein